MARNSFAALVLAVVSAVGVFGQSQSAPPQNPPPAPDPNQQPLTFRAEVNYVEVDARVLDAQGNSSPDSPRAIFNCSKTASHKRSRSSLR